MPFDDNAIARTLNKKYSDIRTPADVRRERQRIVLRLREHLMRSGEMWVSEISDEELVLMAGEAMQLPE